MGIGDIFTATATRTKYAEKTYPDWVVFKHASGALSVSRLGHMKAWEVQGKLQWGTTYEPRKMTAGDLEAYQELMAEYAKLNRKLEKLKVKAYHRGEVVTIERVAKIANDVEGKGG